jgi:hypothetical protein
VKTKKKIRVLFSLLSINQPLPKATANEINRNRKQIRRKIESAEQVMLCERSVSREN